MEQKERERKIINGEIENNSRKKCRTLGLVNLCSSMVRFPRFSSFFSSFSSSFPFPFSFSFSASWAFFFLILWENPKRKYYICEWKRRIKKNTKLVRSIGSKHTKGKGNHEKEIKCKKGENLRCILRRQALREGLAETKVDVVSQQSAFVVRLAALPLRDPLLNSERRREEREERGEGGERKGEKERARRKKGIKDESMYSERSRTVECFFFANRLVRIFQREMKN